MKARSASKQIDDIIKLHGGWRGDTVKRLRAVVKAADPDIVEEVKWKMPSMPEGLPVWSRDGIVCIAQTFKDNVKLVFPKGVDISDPKNLFNARLKSKTDRAVEFREGDVIDEAGIKALVVEAVKLNVGKSDNRTN